MSNQIVEAGAKAQVGWQRVPVEPTPEMLAAARQAALPMVMLDSRMARQDMEMRVRYAAMLAAAPSDD